MRTAQCSLYLSLTLVYKYLSIMNNEHKTHLLSTHVQCSTVRYSTVVRVCTVLCSVRGSQLSAVDLGRPVLCCRVLESAA